jgi:hypothetical protein
MKSPLARLSSLWHFPGWFPEIVMIRSSRIRNQVRLLALAGLVGVVAGVGAITWRPKQPNIMRWAFCCRLPLSPTKRVPFLLRDGKSNLVFPRKFSFVVHGICDRPQLDEAVGLPYSIAEFGRLLRSRHRQAASRVIEAAG